MRRATAIGLAALALGSATCGAAAAQDWRLEPNFGSVTLVSGFTPDPYYRPLQSGGDIDAARVSNGACQGFITEAPDFRVNFTAGDQGLDLTFSVNARADTTLVINGPDGQWHCDDDSGNGGLNPSYTFSRPPSGQYDVWVGTYGGARLEPATLSVSELYSN